jgi:hypothetical protein
MLYGRCRVKVSLPMAMPCQRVSLLDRAGQGMAYDATASTNWVRPGFRFKFCGETGI